MVSKVSSDIETIKQIKKDRNVELVIDKVILLSFCFSTLRELFFTFILAWLSPNRDWMWISPTKWRKHSSRSCKRKRKRKACEKPFSSTAITRYSRMRRISKRCTRVILGSCANSTAWIGYAKNNTRGTATKKKSKSTTSANSNSNSSTSKTARSNLLISSALLRQANLRIYVDPCSRNRWGLRSTQPIPRFHRTTTTQSILLSRSKPCTAFK